MEKNHKKIKLKIKGMHCASCEVLLERDLKKVAGVDNVRVKQHSGTADLFVQRDIALDELQKAISQEGYQLSFWEDAGMLKSESHSKRDWLEIGAIFLIVIGLYLAFKQFNLLPDFAITENMSYGFVFLIGLVAAMSTCIAVTGGLLLAVAAKNGEGKFKPHLLFNAGRIVSYTVLGGVVGAIGSTLTLSPLVGGILTIAVSLIMIVMGLQLINLFPRLGFLVPKMPKFLAHKIHNLNSPFWLGAATFFLPCGFTQALQLYVLSQGDAVKGALTMLAFSLGTLPALLSLSVISSFAKGGFRKYFLKVAGVVVVMLGLFNISSGWRLTNSNFNLKAQVADAVVDNNVDLGGIKQVVQMAVRGLDYYPQRIEVKTGIPVEWQVDGSKAAGCARVLTVPALGINEYLQPSGVKKISFTPKNKGKLAFTCSMGMTYGEIIIN